MSPFTPHHEGKRSPSENQRDMEHFRDENRMAECHFDSVHVNTYIVQNTKGILGEKSNRKQKEMEGPCSIGVLDTPGIGNRFRYS